MKNILSVILIFFLSISTISAVPVLTINSPQAITYTQQKIPVNVTSNEPVDFYTKSPMTNRLVKLDSNFYNSFLYGKTGNHTFTIYANNSNGSVNQSVSFIMSISNPINITECGQLISSNAEYQVMNNLSGACINWNEDVNNISLNLNGFTIEGSQAPISAACFFSKIFNGTLNKTTELGYGALDLQSGNSCLFQDIKMESISYGITVYTSEKMFFENVNITAPVGLFADNAGGMDMNLKKVNFVGSRDGLGQSVFLHHSVEDTITLENVTFANYTQHIDLGSNFQVEYIIRNSLLNFSNVIPPYGFARFITQHLAVINLTNQSGSPISGAIEIAQSGFNITNPPVISGIDSNPTAHVFAGTNESGIAEVFLTEDIVIKKTFSPTETVNVSFDPYILTARSAGVTNNTQINFSQTNSTIKVPISLHQTTASSLPPCTILQMLDLNNDGEISTQDALIIIRHKTNQSVSFNSTKSCQGINLNPF